MTYHYFTKLFLLLFALFALGLSAAPRDPAPAPVRKPPPVIEVPAPRPVTEQGGNNGGKETPDEKENDFVEKLADACE
jgi:hypothetical protein